MKFLESYNVIAYVIAVITATWRILPIRKPPLGVCVAGYIFTLSAILSFVAKWPTYAFSWLLLIIFICEILGGLDFESLCNELGGEENDGHQRRDSYD